MNTPNEEGSPYRCPVCRAKLGAETAKPTHNAPCRGCGHYLWCRMRTAGGVAILDVLPGRVPAYAGRLADSLAESGGAPRVVLNLSRVTHAGSLFLSRLMDFHTAIQRVEGRVILCCLHPAVQEAISVTKLDKILEIVDDDEAALATI